MWYGSLVVRHGSDRPLALYQLNSLRRNSCRVAGWGTEGGGIEPHIIPRVRIYTKTGDSGETSLFDKSRVSKSHPRVEAYGDVDELNACLGAARAAGADPELDAVLETIQRQLFAVGARLADPASRIAARVEKAAVQPADVERLEKWIDSFEQGLPPLRKFILPGGSVGGAWLHLSRTV